MAKRRRRTTRKSTTPSKPRTRGAAKQRTFRDGMKPPNHSKQLDFPPKDAPAYYHQFPTSDLLESDGTSSNSNHWLFIDHRHTAKLRGVKGGRTMDAMYRRLSKQYPDLSQVDFVNAFLSTFDVPPTWMDPEVFVRAYVLKDEEVLKELELLRTGKHLSLKILERHLLRLYSEAYEAYARKKFSGAVGTLAEFVAAHYCDKYKE
jgi:hypothetical protein